jgi:hypothetical protein
LRVNANKRVVAYIIAPYTGLNPSNEGALINVDGVATNMTLAHSILFRALNNSSEYLQIPLLEGS